MKKQYKGKPGDTDLHHVRDLPNGYSLWRCTNAGNTSYSMIVNPDGDVIKSITRDREHLMLDNFNYFLVMRGCRDDEQHY